MFQHGALEELWIPDAESASPEVQTADDTSDATARELPLLPGRCTCLAEPESTDPEPQWTGQSGALSLAAARRRAKREEDEADDDAFHFEDDDEDVEEEDEEYDDEEFFEDDEDEDFDEDEEEEEDE